MKTYYIYLFNKYNGVKYSQSILVENVHYTIENNEFKLNTDVVTIDQDAHYKITNEILPTNCKIINNVIIEISEQETNTLLKNMNKNIRILKKEELEKKYKEIQYFFIKNQFLFKVPLRNEDGYFLFKEKVNIACNYGYATIRWPDYNSNIDQELKLVKDTWLKIGEIAENISVSNWIIYDNLKKKILNNDISEDEISKLEINFPEIKTFEIELM